MMRNCTWYSLAIVLLLTLVFVTLGCNAQTDRLLKCWSFQPIRYLVRSWRIDIRDLQGKLLLQVEVELLDSAWSDPEPPFLFVVEVANSEGDSLHKLNSQKRGRGSKYPLLRFPSLQPSFQVTVYDSSGEKVLAYETEGEKFVLLGTGNLLQNGIYLCQMWARIPNEWVRTTGVHKLAVLR